MQNTTFLKQIIKNKSGLFLIYLLKMIGNISENLKALRGKL